MADVQVPPEHYDFEKYDDLERWISYWYQIRATLAHQPRRVLEIGPGSGVFRSYLRNVGVHVDSLDIDATRQPEYVGDAAKLDELLPPGVTFDVICAFQILEHLPFEHFEACLDGISKRAAFANISLPYRGQRFRLAFWSGDFQLSLGHKFMLPWKLPRCPEHHWELGYGFSARRITGIMSKYFEVLQRGFVKENPYHYMWSLKSRRFSDTLLTA